MDRSLYGALAIRSWQAQERYGLCEQGCSLHLSSLLHATDQRVDTCIKSLATSCSVKTEPGPLDCNRRSLHAGVTQLPLDYHKAALDCHDMPIKYICLIIMKQTLSVLTRKPWLSSPD